MAARPSSSFFSASVSRLTADRLLLFGATGDLAQRRLLASRFALDAGGLGGPEVKGRVGVSTCKLLLLCPI